MKIKETERGFRILLAEKYQNQPGEFTRLIQESSVIGDDVFSYSSASYLTIGNKKYRFGELEILSDGFIFRELTLIK